MARYKLIEFGDSEVVTCMRVKRVQWVGHAARTESQSELWKEVSEKEGPSESRRIDGETKC